MKLTINQTEIETAIAAFVETQGISLEGKNTTVSITAGRGEKGMSAEIDIVPDDKTGKDESSAAEEETTETTDDSSDNTGTSEEDNPQGSLFP